MNVQDSKTSNEAKIRDLIDQRVNALYAKDAAAVLSALTTDFVAFSLAPPLISTMTDAEAYDAWFATWRGPIGTAVCPPPLFVSGGFRGTPNLHLVNGTPASAQEGQLWY